MDGLAGPAAVDCGEVPSEPNDDPAGCAWGCAVEALANGSGFQVWAPLQGIDSRSFEVTVSDGEAVWVLLQETWPLEDPMASVTGWDCVGPVVASDPETGVLLVTCTAYEPIERYLVCGEAHGDELPWPYGP